MAKVNRQKLILLVVLFFAFILRIWRINVAPVSLFSDELDIGYHAYSIIKTGKDYSGNSWPLHFESYADVRTPIYIYSSIPTVYLFGISALGIRLPAVIFGVFSIWAFFLLVKCLFKNEKIALLGAFFMSISPWHLQYSRAGFEATALLFFLLFGLYLYYRSFKEEKYFWLSILFITLTPWVYSTAKLFTPLLLGFILLSKKTYEISILELRKGVLTGLLVGLPLVYITFFGGGGTRANYISVFTDPIVSTESSYSILLDAQVQGKNRNLLNKIASRIVHNKYRFWGERVVNNYLRAFSTDFLFIKGDLNLRHSPDGVGQFYKIEFFALLFGAGLFFLSHRDLKLRIFMLFWIFAGILPAALTRDGGDHATRLIVILPAFLILIVYGLQQGVELVSKRIRRPVLFTYFILLLLCFFSYQHIYWVHNPWHSERAWHAGYKEIVEVVKAYEVDYDKIIITNAVEPPEIFFAAYYPYQPALWQMGLDKKHLDGFGELKKIDKYYFGQIGEEGIEKLYNYLDEKTLYIAAEREVGANLLSDPAKSPQGLKLINVVTYPSGEPAFYFFKLGELNQ
jgi:4-amino-4-deoxy-L-arabinose transferase-like glycosyltransferase